MIKRADLLSVWVWSSEIPHQLLKAHYSIEQCPGNSRSIDRSSLLHIPDQTEGASALYVFTPSVCLCTESPHMMKAVLFSDHHKFINVTEKADGKKNCYRTTHNKKKQILRLCCRLLSHTGRPFIIHLSITDITDDIITCTGTITAGK